MKCIFCAVFNPESTNYSQARRLRDCKVEVVEFPYRQIFKKDGVPAMNIELIRLAEKEKPDFILYAKCHQVLVETIQAIKGPRHILWFPDTFAAGNWNEELVDKIKLCDASLFAWKGPCKRALNYTSAAYHICEGYDEEVNKQVHKEKVYDVSFIGAIDGDRSRYWQAYQFAQIENAYGVKHNEAVAMSRINLNFTRSGGASDRVYKVLAAGGFLLTQPWPGMEEELTPGVHMGVFDGPDEMVKEIEYYLLNEKVRKHVAECGHRIVKKYTRLHWAQKVLEVVWGISQ